jgi:2-polyprenyl-3-methyl-5-hydroxy-6-metoxy-1,4-benzoquinol methylase
MKSCKNCAEKDFHTIVRRLDSVYQREKQYDVLKCTNCGLAQTFPEPDSSVLNLIYESRYAYEIHDLVKNEKRRRAKKLAEIYFKHSKTNAILEFGCGAGILLDVFRSAGVNIKGVESSREVAEAANKVLGSELVQCNTAEQFIKIEGNVNEDVVMSHTLEHLPGAMDFLDYLANNMQRERVLVLVVPNLARGQRLLLKRCWSYWQVPVHIFHFDEKCLRFILEERGFEIRAIHYRNQDFMGLGVYLLNIFKMKSESVRLSNRMKKLISLFAHLWSFAYKFGKHDLIIVAEKIR